MGLFLHSFVLVPYHSWRISHAKHHAATGHMTRDEVFVPRTASYHKAAPTGKKLRVSANIELDELLEDAPIYRLYWLLIQQLFGWPAYLFSNASGQLWYPAWTNHFQPSSLVFDKRHRNQVLLSDAFLVGMVSLITLFGYFHGGLAGVVKYYFIPYLGVNHWLVMITYLQHTDPSLPHYSADQWNFQRGALCTMDRNLMGPVGPYLMHGICETHGEFRRAASSSPFLVADVSRPSQSPTTSPPRSRTTTRGRQQRRSRTSSASTVRHCSKPACEQGASADSLNLQSDNYTDENMFVSLYKNYTQCRYVDDEGSVLFYRDAYGRKRRTAVMPDVPSDSGVEGL